MADRRPQRIAALIEALLPLKLDGLLLTNAPNIRYLTGFTGSSALVFVSARGDLLFITDFRYKTQASAEVGDIADVEIEQQNLWARLWQRLPFLAGVEIAGFESHHLVHRDFERLLDAGKRWQWRPTLDLVENLRERKDPDEVARISEATGIATRALARTLPQIHVGMTELQVAAALEGLAARGGLRRVPISFHCRVRRAVCAAARRHLGADHTALETSCSSTLAPRRPAIAPTSRAPW